MSNNEEQDKTNSDPIYAQIRRKIQPKVPEKKRSHSNDRVYLPMLLNTNGDIKTGHLVKDSIFKRRDDEKKKVVTSQLKAMDEINEKLKTIEESQKKICTDLDELKHHVMSEHQILRQLINDLQTGVIKSIDQQEKFALSVHDQLTETSDHIGGQLMKVMKELQEVGNNHKHMVTSLSLIVSSYVVPSVRSDKSGGKENTK